MRYIYYILCDIGALCYIIYIILYNGVGQQAHRDPPSPHMGRDHNRPIPNSGRI